MMTTGAKPLVIIPCDPGMSGKGKEGKPVAAGMLAFWPDGTIEFVGRVSKRVKGTDTASHRVDTWESAVRELVVRAQSRKWDVRCVAVEGARGVGGSGYLLQYLVHHIRDCCRPVDENVGQWPQPMGIECVIVPPTKMKAFVTGSGSASKEDVAAWVKMLVPNLPEFDEDDWYDMVGIGIAAWMMLKEQELVENAE